MKPGVTPVLSAAWWKTNKGTLASSNPLETALQKYEKIKSDFERTIETPNADGYGAFAAAKTYLGVDLVKAVDAQIKSCNKLIHKDTIAGLTKYKTVVIPAEKTALDKTFNGFKSRHEGAFDSMIEAMQSTIKTLEPVAALSARTVLDCEAKAPEIDKALAQATVAKANANATAAGAAMKTAVEASAFIAAKHQALGNAIKGAPKSWAYDRKIAASGDSTVVNKLMDRKSTLEAQIENNWAKVEEINKQGQAGMSQTRTVAQGSSDAEAALVGAFNRMVNRAFALAQTNDVPAREMKAAMSNLEGDIEAYGKAKDPKEKAKHKKLAQDNLKMAKVQQGALKSALEKGKSEIDGLVKAMPAKVVNRSNPAFSKMFVEYDKAMRSFTEDTEILTKKTDQLKKLEPQVTKLA